MKKILWICLILWALGMCGEQAQARDIVEKWRCFGQYDFDKKEVVIELEGRIPAGEEWGPGQIWVRGIGQDGGFTIRGVNWWWEWDGGQHGFVIHPDGSGGYYDFEGRRDLRVLPSQTYNCVSP